MSQYKRNKNSSQESNELNNPNTNNCLNEIIKSSNTTSSNIIEPILSSGKTFCEKKYLELLIELIKSNNHQIIKHKTFINANLFEPSVIDSQTKTPNNFKRKRKENSLSSHPCNTTEHLTPEDLNKLIASLDEEFNEHQKKLQLHLEMKNKEKENELRNLKEEFINEKKYIIDSLASDIDNQKKLISQKRAYIVHLDKSKLFLENQEKNYQSVVSLKKYIANDYYKTYIDRKNVLTAELAKTNSGYIKKANTEGGKFLNQNKASSKSNKNVSDKNMIMAQNQLKTGTGGLKGKKDSLPKTNNLLNYNKKTGGK